MSKKKLLWVGDAVIASGFARATHKILDTLHKHFDVSVLGMGTWGDPHIYPYWIFPCTTGDAFGYNRIESLTKYLQPDVIIIQQDPWNFKPYLDCIPTDIPVIGAVAVDGKCCRGYELNRLAHSVFWTNFGRDEAQRGGYLGESSVIPLGVDLDVYHPQDKRQVMEELGMFESLPVHGLPKDAFIVGYVGRNQVRKRLDLTIRYFAEWIHRFHIEDAGLWLHLAPTGDDAYDLELLRQYYGVKKQVMLPRVPFGHGITEARLADVYSLSDVMLFTTQGEGFGLPVFEAMACGTPVIVPKWSALEELTDGTALQVECSSTAATFPSGITTIGGIPDEEMTINALQTLYTDKKAREAYTVLGLKRVNEERFRWSHIGERWLDVVNAVVDRSMSLSEPVETEVLSHAV